MGSDKEFFMRPPEQVLHGVDMFITALIYGLLQEYQDQAQINEMLGIFPSLGANMIYSPLHLRCTT